MGLTRRLFLVGSACAAASALGAVPASGEVDVAIVGAGAAGIAAARRVAAANRSFALIEANDIVGGRCSTNIGIFGVPFDIGAHWIHLPQSNPVVSLANQNGIATYPSPRGQRVRIGRRYASEGELEEFQTKLLVSRRAIEDAARKVDTSCAKALPKNLGDWRPLIDFVLGPFWCGRDLDDVSAIDFSKSTERRNSAFCSAGFGSLLAKLATGLPVQLATPARRISWAGVAGVEIETPKGVIRARTAIITVSSGVLSAGTIRFVPDLSKRQQDAIAKLAMGSYEHIALELPGNPLGFEPDDLIYEKCKGTQTAAVLGNVSGTPLCMVEVGGSFARDLAMQGEEAMVAFATEWLSDLYGADVKKMVRRASATKWHDNPLALGSFSAAAVGGQASRRILMEPLNNRVWFAGEAAHETLWGTVGGAWESGDRTAIQALRRIGVVIEAPNSDAAPSIPQAPVGHRQPRPSDIPSRRRAGQPAVYPPFREMPTICADC